MRFLIVGLNYLPESTSIGPYTADLAEHLVSSGHQVQVLTGFPMAPQWRIWDGYRGRRFMREIINGVPVLRTYLYVPAQPGKALKRILFDVSFAISALLGGVAVGGCDVIVAISPPLQLGITAWCLSLLRRAGLFVHLQDLVPDAAIAVGLLREKSLPVRIARALERFVYGRARGIGVICDGFARRLINKGVPPNKVSVLPNYIDLDFMCQFERNNGFRQQQGIQDGDFLVMYSGSVALKQGLETFVETAAKFSRDEGVVFYLVGEGPYLEALRKRAQQLRAPTLRFLPLQPREVLPAQLSAADALVITQKRAVTDVVFPGKLLYYMAAGRPIVAAVSLESETGRFVSGREVGLVVPPEEPQALAGAIRRLQQNPDEAGRLGRNGRRVVEEQFDRSVVLKRFAQHLESLAKTKR
jgi:colanic acid biosynthesis glycosyl transferase WcaI